MNVLRDGNAVKSMQPESAKETPPSTRRVLSSHGSRRSHVARPHSSAARRSSRYKGWICAVLGRCVRLSGAPGAAGQLDADVEVQVLGEQVLEFAAFDDGEPVVTGREGFGF